MHKDRHFKIEMKIRDKKWKKMMAREEDKEHKEDEFLSEGEEVIEPESDGENEINKKIKMN